MIRRCEAGDFETIWSIINDGALAYRGKIPNDRMADPYMSREELRHQMDEGVVFWGYQDGGELNGVMACRRLRMSRWSACLVRTGSQDRGIGAELLRHLRAMTQAPVLIGTWAAAEWAIHFYQRHGFEVIGEQEKERLLRRYWKVPKRQIETSVVLADERWRSRGEPLV